MTTPSKEENKHHLEHTEEIDSDPSPAKPHNEDDILGEYTASEARKIIHRVDRRLVSVVGALYFISLLDRNNLSAAVLAGMATDLHLNVGYRYSIITLVFFTTYIVFQFPSTIIIRYLGPRLHLFAISFSWGSVVIGMAFVKDWHALAALRVILGIFEAGFFPGCVYLLSTWYTRFELHKRYSVFYVIGSSASALSGIIAFGVMQMKGLQGYNGWSWIFIVEGIITLLIAIMSYVFLVDFPDGNKPNWNFLSQKEIRFIVARVNADRGDADTEKFSWAKFLGAGLDWKIWAYGMLFGMTTTVTYALSYFLPLILRDGMGFSVGAAQCLVAPPYVAAGLLMYGCGWLGDKYHTRGPIMLFNFILCLIGVPLIGFVDHDHTAIRYFGVFLVCMGANANIPAIMTYQANNIRGHWKRAFCSATLVGLGAVGGIIGSLVFRSQDAPQYHPGLWACIASQLINFVIVIALTLTFKIQNRKAERGEIVIEGGDANFRYTI